MEQQEVKATSIFLSAAVVVPWSMVHGLTWRRLVNSIQ